MVKEFKNKKFTTLYWSENLPDLKPIENLWAICKNRLYDENQNGRNFNSGVILRGDNQGKLQKSN